MSLRQLTTAIATVVVVAGGLAASPAEARFGKGNSGGTSSSGGGRSGGSSSSSSSSSSGSSGTYHSAVPVGGGSSNSGGGGSYVAPSRWSFGWGARPWRYGFYSGCYVPMYGYGYGYYAATTRSATLVEPAGQVAQEPSAIRVTTGVEGMTYLNGQRGFTLGLSGMFEGENWGFYLAGQNISVAADDGTNTTDNIQNLSARVTFAFLTGRYGRLRAELGADAVFAPDIAMVGPTGGLSGSLWIAGPVAIEASAMVTPYPFWQLDWRAGLALGLGPVGIRGGWRVQVLDDRGVVDGVVHRDVFSGPYVGLAVVF